MKENKLILTEKQPVKIFRIFTLFTFFVISLIILKQCIDVKTIHQAKEATTATHEAYRIYSNIKFGWTVYNKVQEFSKKKELTKEETVQTEQTETTETAKETDKWQDKKRSGKNEPHKNQDVKKSLEKQIEGAKTKLKELNDKKPSEKLKGHRKEVAKLEKTINSLQKELKSKGETHGRIGK